MKRRHFVGTTTLALLGAGCRLESREAPGDQRAPDPGDEATLPQSLAALTSMRAQATPITVDERRARIERAKRFMTEQKIGCLMLTGGTSLEYFSGLRWGLSERLTGLFLPVRGAPFLVTPKFEEERTMEQVRVGPLGEGTELLTWEEDQSPFALVASGLRSRGLATSTLGVEETVRFVFSDSVAKASPALKLTSATPVTAGCRTIKDAHELALMRLASEVTLKAYEAAYRALTDGMTQSRFASLVSRAHSRLGFEGGAGVQVGAYSANPHGSLAPQVITEGTILLIDGGCKVEGYSSDISRTFVLGRATDKMKRVFDIELEAQTAALKAARPGVPCEAVDAAARKVIVDAGYGPDYKYFTHRVGHGMGMDGHEWPYLVRGNKLPLAPGMTFSDEPGIYLPGEFGVRLEDDMVITESGAELLTPQSQSLEDPFGTPSAS
jgi:Xaa-Pro dipeptidase